MFLFVINKNNNNVVSICHIIIIICSVASAPTSPFANSIASSKPVVSTSLLVINYPLINYPLICVEYIFNFDKNKNMLVLIPVKKTFIYNFYRDQN